MHDQTHTFINSLLQSQHQFMQAMADHRDQLSETMSSMAHTYLDTSIDRLKRFHDHVANDASGLKSDMLEATLKAAIDQHQHLKDRLTVHQHHANSHKETLRRLAMGVMATFGVMSGVKAADAFESGQGNGGANSSASTTQKATLGRSSIESGSQGSMKDLKAFFERGSSAQSHATIHSTPPKATTPTKPVMITPQASSKNQDEQVTPPKATTPTKPVMITPQASSKNQDEQGKVELAQSHATIHSTPPKATALPKAVEAMPQPMKAGISSNSDIEALQFATRFIGSTLADVKAQGVLLLKNLKDSKTATPVILRQAARILTDKMIELELASELLQSSKSLSTSTKTDVEVADSLLSQLNANLSSSTSVAQGIPDVAMEVPDVQHASFEDAMNAAIGFINLGPDNYPKAFDLLLSSAIDYGGQPEHKIRAAEEIIKLHGKYQTEGKNDELTLEAAMKLLDTVVRDKSSKPEAILDVLKLLREFESPVFKIKLGHIDKRNTEWLAYNALSNFKNPAYNRLAAEGVMKLSSNNHSQAVDFYLISVAPDRNPTSKDIKLAAEAVKNLGDEYKDAQANLWLSYGLHKDTSSTNTIFAAHKLVALGEAYHDRAATLYVEGSSKPNAAPKDIISAANNLNAFGEKYHEKAATLAVIAANTLNDDIRYNILAGQLLLRLGEPYYEMAAELFEKVTKHPDAKPDVFVEAAKGLKSLGPAYHEKAAALFEAAGNDNDAKPVDIILAASNLERLGEAYHNKAAELYKKVLSHKDLDSAKKSFANDGLKRLGKK